MVESICNGGDAGSIPGVQEDSLEKEMATFLPGKFSDRGACWATVHRGCKVSAHDLVTEQGEVVDLMASVYFHNLSAH